MSTVKDLLDNKELLVEMVLVKMVASGLNKIEMARAIGINFDTFNSFLKSRRPTSVKSLMKIIKYLGVE